MDQQNPQTPQVQRVRIDISTRTIIKIILIGLIFAAAFWLRDLLLLLFVVFILNSAIDPLVDKLEQRGIPRALSTFVLLVGGVGIVVTIIALLVPPIAQQLLELATHVPAYYDRVLFEYSQLRGTIPPTIVENIQKLLSSLGDGLRAGAEGTVSAVSSLFGALVSVLTILVLTFYLTIENGSFRKLLSSIVPGQYQSHADDLLERIREKMGAWVRGQLSLSLIIGLLIFIGLAALGVDYALVLAMLAGLMELVPVVGVVIAIVPALFLAFSESPILAIGVLVLYTIVQQLENHLIVPKVMQKAVGLNPAVIIIALLIGTKIAGILGILLAVPVVTTLSIVVPYVLERQYEKNPS